MKPTIKFLRSSTEINKLASVSTMQHAKKINKFSINFGVSNLDFFSSTTPFHLAMSFDKSLMNLKLLDLVKFSCSLTEVVYKSSRSFPDAIFSLFHLTGNNTSRSLRSLIYFSFA